MMMLLGQAFWETIVMVASSGVVGIFFGFPLGALLYVTGPRGLCEQGPLYQGLSFSVNAARSIPYIILMVLIIPLTRFLAGSAIGTAAAIVPLALSAILLIGRAVEENLRRVPEGLIEVGRVSGATHRDILTRIVFVEALPAIVADVTLIVINLIGFSAMAGAVGGGGLGDLAIRYGYQRYEGELLVAIVVILIICVQAVQMIGDTLVRRLRKGPVL